MHETNGEQNEVISPASPPLSTRQRKPALTRRQHIERWFQVITAIMLGVVTVATAWSGYQAARWGGMQSTKYAEASALRVEATRDTPLQHTVVVCRTTKPRARRSRSESFYNGMLRHGMILLISTSVPKPSSRIGASRRG